MKKNDILALIIAASLTTVMTSCGPKEEANSTETPALQSSEAQYNETVTEAEEEVVIEPTQEILDADIDSCKIQLGNKVYTLPVKLQTLLEDGATITNDVNPESDILEPGLYSGRYVRFIMDGKEYGITFKMPGENKNKLLLKDGVATSIRPGISDDTVYCINVIFPKGIKIGSSIDEVKAILGTPTEENLDCIVYELLKENDKNSGYRLEVYLDLETKNVKAINYDYT